jgi:hypothetical protein
MQAYHQHLPAALRGDHTLLAARADGHVRGDVEVTILEGGGRIGAEPLRTCDLNTCVQSSHEHPVAARKDLRTSDTEQRKVYLYRT